MRRLIVEAAGTATLVLVGCGAVTLGNLGGILGGTSPFAALASLPIGFAFGITVAALAYSIGPLSGCHLNPAVSAGAWAAGRLSTADCIGYSVAQIVGATLGAALLLLILYGRGAGYDVAAGGLGENGWGAGYLGAYGLGAAFLTEVIATFIFVAVILGVTAQDVHKATAGLIIGLTLVVLHLPFIYVTGLSVNPARSIGPALFVGGNAIAQLWLFILAPLLGGLAAGAAFRSGYFDYSRTDL